MAKKILKGPDEGLVPHQYSELNKEFYEDYFSEYFFTKFAVMSNLIQNSEKMLEIINDPTLNINFGKLTADPFRIKQEELIKFGKLELSTMYYHCIETFLRLFLAHITVPQCPWLEMNKETSYHKFKDNLKNLAKGNFEFKAEGDWTSDELICYVFTTKRLPDKVNGDEKIKSLKEWIQWSANELVEVYDYNAYKHGLTLVAEKSGFKMGYPDDIKLEKHEESLKIIHKKKKRDRFVWVKTVKFTPFDFRSTCIFVLYKLSLNIITSGKWNYLKENPYGLLELFLPDGFLVPSKILAKLSETNEPFSKIIPTGFSMELTYFKDQ